MPLAPIQQHVEALAQERGYPAEAVEDCLRQPLQSVPILRALLGRAARGLALSDAELSQLFLGLHILAQLRDQPSCPPLLRLLRRPTDEVEAVLGDALTETLPKIVASLYDGDADALFDTIADATVDEFVRDALWRAAAFLTFQDRIGSDVMAAFIVRFDDERLAPARDMGWYGWLEAIAQLGLQDLASRVEPLWSDDRLPENLLDREHFDEDLAIALRDPRDAARFEQTQAGTIDDVGAALAWADWNGAPEPYLNPMRDVGRNDPCPCGSGKKAKKCCLAPA